MAIIGCHCQLAHQRILAHNEAAKTMIEEIQLSTWAAFRDEVARIRRQYGYNEIAIPEDKLAKGVSLPGGVHRRRNTVLFRGQGDASWPIRTTLERKTNSRPMRVADYLVYADYCVNEIESFTGRRWHFPNRQELVKEMQHTEDESRVHLPAYGFLVYLRHHGFPSPLLDWSESPYIAAFFAFWEKSKADTVAILAYIRSASGGSPLGGAHMITRQGPYVTTHQRHFAQKTQYTVATQWDEKENRHYFCSHDDVFRQPSPDQNILVKITLSSGVRREALRELSDYNINPFTLFQTEDALIRTMELKQFDIEGE